MILPIISICLSLAAILLTWVLRKRYRSEGYKKAQDIWYERGFSDGWDKRTARYDEALKAINRPRTGPREIEIGTDIGTTSTKGGK